MSLIYAVSEKIFFVEFEHLICMQEAVCQGKILKLFLDQTLTYERRGTQKIVINVLKTNSLSNRRDVLAPSTVWRLFFLARDVLSPRHIDDLKFRCQDILTPIKLAQRPVGIIVVICNFCSVEAFFPVYHIVLPKCDF